MPNRKRVKQEAPDEATQLKNRLEETEETLRAIRQYMVDAFVVTRESGEQVVTLSDTSFPYRMMVESMNEGAVTLIPDGTIFYSNRRFCEMLQIDCEKLIGARFQDLIQPQDQDAFDAIFKDAWQSGQSGERGEFCLQAMKGNCLPVQLSVYPLIEDNIKGIAIIATDITERIQAAEKIRSLAAALARAEHEERHRISQILHDDLQQRLFAIKAQLAFMKQASDENDRTPMPTEMQITIDQLLHWLSEAISLTRNLSIDISPIVLQGEGLTEAIVWLSSQMKELYGLQVKLKAEKSFSQLGSSMRVLLFQAVRELLFNIVKHSGISQATVNLEEVDGRCRIEISDSGKGFDAQAIMNNPNTHGLLIVQDRLNVMGGTMKVDSKPGDGVRVVIEVPLMGSSG